MMHTLAGQRSLAIALFVGVLACGLPAGATIVRFDTSLGNVDVRLYDTVTPLSVANFLAYVTDGRYDGTFIHRSMYNFVVQGGGFSYDTEQELLGEVEAFDPVLNEPGISNVRGTIAMAKLGGDPDSATSQWFFNVADNSANLDYQNGGFTVFGGVLGDGMNVVDAINDLYTYDLDGTYYSTFDDVPIRDGATTYADGLVFINSVTVLSLAAGDYDCNGAVDAADYDVWAHSVQSTADAAADGNGDGIVDAADYTIWRDSMTAGSGAIVSAVVPEPGSVVLLLMAMAGLLMAVGRSLPGKSQARYLPNV